MVARRYCTSGAASSSFSGVSGAVAHLRGWGARTCGARQRGKGCSCEAVWRCDAHDLAAPGGGPRPGSIVLSRGGGRSRVISGLDRRCAGGAPDLKLLFSSVIARRLTGTRAGWRPRWICSTRRLPLTGRPPTCDRSWRSVGARRPAHAGTSSSAGPSCSSIGEGSIAAWPQSSDILPVSG